MLGTCWRELCMCSCVALTSLAFQHCCVQAVHVRAWVAHCCTAYYFTAAQRVNPRTLRVRSAGDASEQAYFGMLDETLL